MNDATPPYVEPQNDAEFEALADQLLFAMRHLTEQMQCNRVEIDLLKIETARMEAENRIVLKRLKLAV